MADKKGASGEKVLYCSFCGKSQHEVKKLIAGPSVFICDECIAVCNSILEDDRQEHSYGAPHKLPKPLALLEGNVEKRPVFLSCKRPFFHQ